MIEWQFRTNACIEVFDPEPFADRLERKRKAETWADPPSSAQVTLSFSRETSIPDGCRDIDHRFTLDLIAVTG
jgi:hypothetical protein